MYKLQDGLKSLNTFLARFKEFKSSPIDVVRYRTASKIYDTFLDFYSCEYSYSSKAGGDVLHEAVLKIADLYLEARNMNAASSDDFYNIIKEKLLPIYSEIVTYQLLHDTSFWCKNASEESSEFEDSMKMLHFTQEVGKKVRLSRSVNNLVSLFNIEMKCSLSKYTLDCVKYLCQAIESENSAKLNSYVATNPYESYVANSTQDFYKFMRLDSFSLRVSNTYDMSFCAADDFNLCLPLFLKNLTHLRPNGLNMTAAKLVSFNSTVLKNMLPYLNNVNIMVDSEFSPYSFAFLFGNRLEKRNVNIFTLMDMMDKIISIVVKKENYEFKPYKTISIEPEYLTFRSVYISEDEINDILDNSNKALSKFKSSVFDNLLLKNDEEVRRPLLPFNPGQLGLVLVSGYVDGLVDEGNGFYHVIKGSVQKRITPSERIEDGQNIYEEVKGNFTTVKIVTGDGQIRSLY